MKFYSPSEIAGLLKIKPATLRKYSIMLEEQNYNIQRNSQNHRIYSDEDIITLRRVITGSKNGVSLEESVRNVVFVKEHNTPTDDTYNEVEPYNDDIKELKEVIQLLVEKMDQQQEQFNQKLDEQQELLSKLLKENENMKKQIEGPKEKKSFFKKIFS